MPRKRAENGKRVVVRITFLLLNLGLGGAEKSTIELIPSLNSLGVDCTIVCMRKETLSFREFAENRGLNVVYLKPGRLRHQVWELAKLLRITKPNVLHAALDEPCLVSRFAGLLTGVCVVNSWINPQYDRLRLQHEGQNRRKIRYIQLLDALSAPLVHRFHAVTPFIGRSMSRSLWISLSRVSVVARGRDLSRYQKLTGPARQQVRSGLGATENDVVAVTVGRQVKQKGFEELIGALPQVVSECPNLRLWLVGTQGERTEALHDLVARLALREHVLFVGHREDVNRLLGAGDLYVCSSLWEGAAGAVIEAMASGLPVVSSDIEPMRDILSDNVTGFLYSAGSASSLASKMLETIRDTVRARSVAQEALRVCYHRYPIERCARRWLHLYQGLVVGRRPAGL